MDKTIRIFRGFLNLRIYNRVFTSKYCASHKDSGEKHGTSSEEGPKSAAEKNSNEHGVNIDGDKDEDKIKLSSENEIATPSQTTNFKPVKTETESDISTSNELPSTGERSLGSKLERLLHISEVYTKSDPDIDRELLSFKKKFTAPKEGVQKSKPGISDFTHSFASLLRKSAFIDLGDPVNKLVVGEIYLTVDNDLYIDFGWKFPAVCSRPKVNPEIYNIGAKVLLRIKDLELTARFLGDKEYTSLLEADCDLLHRINDDGSKYVKLREGPTGQNIPD